MPYVPPHQRNGAVPSPSPPCSFNANGNTRGRAVDFGTARDSDGYYLASGRSVGNTKDNAYQSNSISTSPKRVSNGSFNRAGNQRAGADAEKEAVFPEWQPSERIRRLQNEQIEEVRARLNVDVQITPGTSPAPAPVESFEDMCLHPSIMKDIVFHEYTRPTPIQAQAMPVALSGRDLLGCAETGSGKTAAFSIPMIQHCLAQSPIRHGDGPLALVLAPTRELAQQIEKEVKAFSRSLESFKTAVVVGGTNIGEQRTELRSGVEIVVATPGRFIDHLQQGNSSLSRVSFVVLDEADRMLDMGFEPQIREVMRNLPKHHQTLLFSATMPEEIEGLAQEYMNKPVQVKVGKVSGLTANVSQILEKVTEKEKIDRLLALLVEESSQAEKSGQPQPLTIVFVERKTRCDEVTDAIVAQGLHAVALHGGRSQGEREAALYEFRNGTTNILVATDVASRGLDVTNVAHVVNLDLPKAMEDYVHRIGRTGRAGSTGRATSFYTDRDVFLAAQIRKAIADTEAGNTMAFATGKAARKKEKEQAAAFWEGRLGRTSSGLVGSTTIHVEDKYKYMLAQANVKQEGAADNAWDD
uniref:RNA helicase n=1 Tax=Wollemia nobilis TaxID=56998 RepID=A0A0C9RXP6_9CONI